MIRGSILRGFPEAKDIEPRIRAGRPVPLASTNAEPEFALLQGKIHGTNRKDHADDVDFVFQYGYWEGDTTATSGAATSSASIPDALASGRSYGRGHTGR